MPLEQTPAWIEQDQDGRYPHIVFRADKVSIHGLAYVDENNKHHRTNGPAFMEWHPDGVKKTEKWCSHGDMHRLDGPAFFEWDTKGNLVSRAWYKSGQLHREDGPARKLWESDGTLKSEGWWIEGKLHRENGPALTSYYPSGLKQTEVWYEHNKVGKIVEWSEDGSDHAEMDKWSYLPDY